MLAPDSLFHNMMGLERMSGSKHGFSFFLLIFCLKLCCCIIVCPEIEKQALVGFKKSLEDPDNMLSSWNVSSEDNCCKWRGVVCSNLTGHVHQLRLRRPHGFKGLRGEVNPSLLSLKELKHLDLSQNDFGVKIPSFIGLLTSLENLNLSQAGFHVRIPHNIGNLSNLHTLNLEGHIPSLLNVDSMEWLSGLHRLEYLNMNNVNLSKAANWVQVINTLPSLLHLHLSSCFLKNSLPPSLSDVNTTSLVTLDLSYNNINSSIPDWLYLYKDLEHVDMSSCDLRNTISDAIGNLTSLKTLILSFNSLSGNIPRGIASLCKMQVLELIINNLRGEVSDSFGNMSHCFLEAVTYVDLRGNQLSGYLTQQFGEFKSVQFLELRANSISGTIPTNIGKLSSLHELELAYNNLSGNLPESVGQLLNLEVLSISHNMLEGIVTETHFSNLSTLYILRASGNHLSLKVSSDWVPPFTHLSTLELGSWDLGVDHIPLWIETQKSVAYLDLSNTGISGHIPTWFWEARFLNLSHNNFQVQIPYIKGPEEGYHMVYLSSNQFRGSLPRIANTATELDLSNNSFTAGLSHFLCDTTNQTYRLEILHLGGNQLNGELPDCMMKWPSLRVLNLANNNLSGIIPNSIRFPSSLLSINLHGNKFSGQIPFAVHNCVNLLKLDLGGNEFAGNIPAWIGTSLANLRFLILRSNKLWGDIPSEICHMNALQLLDLSDNAFSGVTPKCIDNFTAMAKKISLDEYDLNYSYYLGVFIESASVATKGREYEYDTILSLVTNIDLSNNNLSGVIPMELTSLVELRSLNLSGNGLTGNIPDNMGDMRQMESLDLSRNSLSGKIPNSFTRMFSLSYVDLSFNNLTGRIPSSTQLLSMNASSFAGNHLCGPPLPNNCTVGAPLVNVVDAKEDDESKVEWLYVFLSLGYAVGLSAFCTGLILKKSWRDAYFGILNCIWNKFYVYFYIRWRSLTTAAQTPTS